MAYDVFNSAAFTAIPVVADPADLVDGTDGLDMSTVPGAAYGKIKRFALRVVASAAGEFNLVLRGYMGSGIWKSVGFSDGDVNSGQSLSSSGAKEWILESGSLALFTHIAAVVTIASGTPTVTLFGAGIGDA